ncbi:unnamed protein product [Rangifer tarandus platyrhynchus]|uniref:Uncharacterized protein n=2 Tax=Rangifer tarandus platyrhynchus TaxID=3082113 RepID=A0ACB1MMK2_RANTA|nr:unnamed protein product [Rangifer tarandus platyrhynchus]
MDCSTPGFPVLHCFPELAQIHPPGNNQVSISCQMDKHHEVISVEYVSASKRTFLGAKEKDILAHGTPWMDLENIKLGHPLVVEWLRICASTAGGTGSIPSQRTRVPLAAQSGKANKNQDIMLSEISSSGPILRGSLPWGTPH